MTELKLLLEENFDVGSINWQNAITHNIFVKLQKENKLNKTEKIFIDMQIPHLKYCIYGNDKAIYKENNDE